MMQVIDYASRIIAVTSLAIISYGLVKAVWMFVKNEFRSEDKAAGIRKLRANFGGYLLFGLELLIAADILKTVVEPTYQELIILGGIVILRTILSIFLNKEIKEID